MRYYDITISDPNGGKVWKPAPNGLGFVRGDGGTTFSTLDPQGRNNPGALNVELDIPAAPFNTPQGSAFIRIWGVGLGMISQSADLAGKDIKVSAGMSKGLPLANPAQKGTVLQGTVFQSFGNWQGVEQTLHLICNPPATQRNIPVTLYWPKGQLLSGALFAAFQQAYSKLGMLVNVNVADIRLNSDGSGEYTSLAQLADYVQQISESVGKPTYGEDYSGVLIKIVGNTVYAYDNQAQQTAKQLEFKDLIGQPTWINPGEVSFKTVMRSDLALGSTIKFPTKGIVAPYVLTTQQAAYPNTPARSKTVFQGEFWLNEVHHFGNFRQPDADSWNTSFTAVPVPQQQ